MESVKQLFRLKQQDEEARRLAREAEAAYVRALLDENKLLRESRKTG